MNKKDLREKVKKILSSLSKKQHQDMSIVVSKNLKSLLLQLYSKNSFIGYLGVYAPIQQEVLWYMSFESKEFPFAVPHMLPKSLMEYHPVDFGHIQRGEIGLELAEHLKSEVVIPDILIIPGLGFSKNGDRLGRGKGYFDRYLSEFQGIKVGVCFDQQVFEQIPIDDYDVKVDYLVNETNIYKID